MLNYERCVATVPVRTYAFMLSYIHFFMNSCIHTRVRQALDHKARESIRQSADAKLDQIFYMCHKKAEVSVRVRGVRGVLHC